MSCIQLKGGIDRREEVCSRSEVELGTTKNIYLPGKEYLCRPILAKLSTTSGKIRFLNTIDDTVATPLTRYFKIV